MCSPNSSNPSNSPDNSTEHPTLISKDKGIEIRDEEKEFNLVVNILVISSVSVIVMLICLVGLVKQCRRCCARMFCLDKCCRSSYNVSALERRQERYHGVGLETPTTGFSDESCSRASSDSSHCSTLLQIG